MSNSTQQPINLYIEESRTVYEANQYAFDKEVNKLLKEGWIMNGSVIVAPDGQLIVNMVKVDPALVGVARKVMDMTAKQLNEMF